MAATKVLAPRMARSSIHSRLAFYNDASASSSGMGFGSGGRGAGSRVCRYWKMGRCKYGENCQFRHSEPDQAAGYDSDSNKQAFLDRGDRRRRSLSDDDNRQKRTFVDGSFNQESRGQKSDGEGPCSFWLGKGCTRPNCHLLHAHGTAPDLGFLTALTGHEKGIRALALSVGSSLLYTAALDGAIRVWDCATGECTKIIPTGGSPYALLCEPPWLIAGLMNQVKVWNMQTMQEQVLNGPNGQVNALVASNNLLFAGVHDGSILVWKFNSMNNMFEPASTLKGHTLAVTTLMVYGNMLYSGSADKSIRIWDLENLKCLHVLHGHTHSITGILCWESHLISSSLDGSIKVWGITESGSVEATYTYHQEGEQKGILAMCGSVDASGKPLLLCAYKDCTVQLFDLPSFQKRGSIFGRLEVKALLTGPNGLVFTGDNSGDVKVWQWSEMLPASS